MLLRFSPETHMPGFGNCLEHVFWGLAINKSCLLSQPALPHPKSPISLVLGHLLYHPFRNTQLNGLCFPFKGLEINGGLRLEEDEG